MTGSRTTRPLALAGALLAAGLLGLALAPRASAQLTATDLRVASNPKVVRVIVDFAGARLTGLERQVDAIDPEIADGRGVVRVNATGITSGATPVTAAGVTARVIRRTGRILVRMDGARNRFKFVQYKVSVPRNGCLQITNWTGTNGRARARGLELQPLFEHGLVLSLRAPGAGGSTLGEKPITATEGTFLPDFSGYAIAGRWIGGTPPIPGIPRRGMLEAWAASAKDGSLECLVQVPIRVVP